MAMLANGQVCLKSLRVAKLFPQALHHQTDDSVCNSIGNQNFVEANGVMHAHYRNRARYANKSPHIPHSFAGRWEGKNCPEARN